jgi:type II secretory pathway pseudopilin PulG
MQLKTKTSFTAGFSLVELIIAMTITLFALMIATSLLAGGFNTRNRENQRSDALADAQRSINIMTREIANSGFGLTNNGIVAADSGPTAIRFRANLNAFSGPGLNDRTTEPDEDVRYFIYSGSSTQVIAKHEINTSTVTTLANRIDSLKIRYYGAKVDYQTNNCDIASDATEVTPSAAGYVVLSICVQLPQIGTRGASGFQPATVVQLTSDVNIRNSSQAKLNEY